VERVECGSSEGREGGGHLGFCGRKETTPQMSSDFASNGPQPFPTFTHRRSTFGQHFFLGYYSPTMDVFLELSFLFDRDAQFSYSNKALFVEISPKS
jgi:hypothetical protein